MIQQMTFQAYQIVANFYLRRSFVGCFGSHECYDADQ